MQAHPVFRKILAALRQAAGFGAYLVRRAAADRCPESAAELTVTSLLAMVPLMAIAFAVVSAVPLFEGMREDIQRFVFESFVPEAGRAVQHYLDAFTDNVANLTTVGLVALGVTALVLLATIESTFNRIWRVGRSRSLLVRFLAYWTTLTLGPVLFGVSLSLSSYLFAAARASGVAELADPISPLTRAAPALMEFAGFTVLYLVIANRPVRWRDAMAGALLATMLFELLKGGIGLYVAAFPTYQTIYGALSVFPILLVWLYLAWMAALLGAELTAALPEWGHKRRLGAGPSTAAQRQIAALDLLRRLAAAHAAGEAVSHWALLGQVEADAAEIDTVLGLLGSQGYLAETRRGRWVLRRDLGKVSLHRLSADLGLGFAGEEMVATSAWQRAALDLIGQVEQVKREAMAESVAAFLDRAEAEE